MTWFNSYYCTDMSLRRNSRSHCPSCGYVLVCVVRLAAYLFCIFRIHMPDHRSSFPAVPAIVPILSGVPFGIGTIPIMTTYPLYCANALASTILLRSTFAAAFPLFSDPMFRTLANGHPVSLHFSPLSHVYFLYAGPPLVYSQVRRSDVCPRNTGNEHIQWTLPGQESLGQGRS
jgi:hypothetical protein